MYDVLNGEKLNSTSGDVDPNDILPKTVLDLGGLPMLCLLSTSLFVVIVTCTTRLCCRLDLHRPFDLFFHRKIWMKPVKYSFIKNYIQYYFLDINWGEVVLMLLYLINCIIFFLFECKSTFKPVDFGSWYTFSNGFGKLGLLNMYLLLFPAHRLSLIQFFFGVGQEKILKYHKLFGFLVYLFVFIHFIMVVMDVIWQHQIGYMFKWESRYFINQPLPGTISGFAMLVLAALSLKKCVRENYYSFFFYTHLLFSILAILFLIFHRTLVTFGFLSVICVITVFDLIWRCCHGIILPAEITYAKFYPKTKTARIVISKRCQLAREGYPGQIAYIWSNLKLFDIPHPFTIAYSSSGKDDFKHRGTTIFMTKRGKFTSKLCDAVSTGGGKKFMVRKDGPYGVGARSSKKYRQVLLIADGPFAAVCFGILIHHIRDEMGKKKKKKKKDNNNKKNTKYKFVWRISRRDYLELFEEEIFFLMGRMSEVDLVFRIFCSEKNPQERQTKSVGRKNVIISSLNPSSLAEEEFYRDRKVSISANGILDMNNQDEEKQKPSVATPLINNSEEIEVADEEAVEAEAEEGEGDEHRRLYDHELDSFSGRQYGGPRVVDDFIFPAERIDWRQEISDFGRSFRTTYVSLQGLPFFTDVVKRAISDLGWRRVFHVDEPVFDF